MSSKKKSSSAVAAATATATSPSLSQKKPTVSTRKVKVACGVCKGPIVDGKEEALLCEGKCGYWLHRGCASVSPSLYTELSTSDDPFICLSCTNIELRLEIKLLKSEISNMNAVRQQLSALEAEVATLSKQLTNLSSSSMARAAVSQPDLPTISNKSNDTSVPTYSTATLKRANNSANPSTTYSHAQSQPSGNRYSSHSVSSVDKKFNIVMYGVSECPKGSPRHERISYDTDLACKTIQSICPELREYAVCDCSRIGKYTEERSRPLMIKFVRSCDAATVLANRHKISKSDHSKVFLKPYMTVAERKTESILLRQRRALIESGVERKLIKIRGNSIFVNKRKVGSANENTFITDQSHSITDLQRQSEEPTPTLNITSTIATTNTTPTSNAMPTFTSGTTSVLSVGTSNNDTFTRSTKSAMPANNTDTDTMSTYVNYTSNMSTNDTLQTQAQTQENPQSDSKPALTNNSQ